MDKRIVINTGPLIALMRMEALEVAAKLDLVFIAPDEVRLELEAGAAAGHPPVRPPWLAVQSLTSPLPVMVTSVLDAGEAAVIQLALDEGIGRVCIDELKGRRMALAVGLKVTGTLGLLGKAKREGVISDVRPFLARALQAGIHYHPELVGRFLNALDDELAS
jgi:predicted nucleic acid-binding protein